MSEPGRVRRLSHEEVRRRLDPGTLPFTTTAEVDPVSTTIGQPRALEAIAFGLEAGGEGFNLYIAGGSGTGREDTAMRFVREYAAGRPAAPDWIYVHNFSKPDQPNAISLPAGQGRKFAAAIAELIQTIQREIPRAFESEEVQNRRDSLVSAANEQRVAVLDKMAKFASDREFSFEIQPTGVMTFPLAEGKPIDADAFQKLPEELRSQIQKRGEEVTAELTTTMRQMRKLDRDTMERLRQMERDVVAFVTNPLFEELREDFQFNAEIVAYLRDLEADVPEHLHDFWPVAPSPQQGSAAELAAIGRNEHLSRYEVNVLVDNSDSHGAPVVLERNPTLANLLGRIEFRAVLGAMVTDFRQIRAGSIHRANGGYLILHVVDLLRNPFAWETLKRALISKEITIESPLEQATVTVAGRLRPEPIPASLKVLLIGPRSVYQALYQLEEDFAELFAVRADFAPDMHWTGEHVRDYAAFIARQVRDQHLLHLDAAAVATVIEFSATQREHQQKLSARMLDIANLVAEASYWAGKAGHDPVMAMDVDTAIRKRMYRSNLIEERLQEMIDERTLAIATAGTVIGQVNGLSVIDLGDYSFGRPSRISARVSPGKAGVQSIERDIELSGPIHSKGVMILAGYLRGQYGAAAPLALSATLTFEQTYDMIDGDSASSTELYALLSALSGTPIDQGIAVTGAVDQFGRVQAVGGVTRKIEGFFAVCNARGLTGSQGVVVPSANVQHLMLDQDVVEAIRNEMFHVWAVETVDQGMALLTGLEAGERDGNGAFPDGSIHALVAARLDQYLAAADSVSAREEDRKSSTKRKTR